ncbi:MAG TPA: hypothetical protein VFH31_13905 [Pyrinomonadaceae bacterium]|nr:hypothetical protein [Pyrinomonadaceae bacterium]
MKNRNSTTKLLAMAIAVGVLTALYAAWGARPAQAIIIQGGKTGLFTLTQGEAVRAHVLNTEGQAGIIINGGIFDSEGNMLAEFPERRLAPGRGTSFEFTPPDIPEGETLPVRIELMVQGASEKSKGVSFIPTCEVFETATGKTSVGHDFIIDDGE